jgi:hypothetical protein
MNASPHGAITDIAIANVMALISSKGGKVSFGVAFDSYRPRHFRKSV